MRLSIQRRLTLAFLGLAVLPLLLAGVVNAALFYRQHSDAELAHLQELSRRVAIEVRKALHQGEAALNTLLLYRDFPRLTAAEQDALLTELLVRHDFVHEVALIDSSGRERIRRSDLEVVLDGNLRDMRAAEAFTRPFTDGEVYYGPIHCDPNGEPLITVSLPLRDLYADSVESVLSLELRLKPLWELVARLEPVEGTRVYVADEHGVVVAHRDPSVVLRETRVQLPPIPATTEGLNGAKALVATSGVRAGQRFFHVVAEHDWGHAMEPLLRNFLALAAVLLLALSVAFAAGAKVFSRVVRPILQMESTARAIAGGDLNQRVAENRDDEIGDLAHSFNAMTEHLQRSLTDLQTEVAVRQRTEQALRDSQRDLKRAQAVGQIGSWRLDVQRNELLWSEETHRIFGVPPGTPLTYEIFLSMVHPEDRPFIDDQWQAALQSEPYDIEHRIIAAGGVKWVRERAELELDDRGTVQGGFGITQDITERKQAEQALRESEARYQTLFETMAQGVVCQDVTGQITDANDAAVHILGLSREQLIGRRTTDAGWRVVRSDGSPFPGDQHPPQVALRTGLPVRDVTLGVFNRPDGQVRWLLVSSVPQTRPGDMLPFQVYTTFSDITERKQTEALLQARLRLSELARRGSLDELMQTAVDEAEQLTGSSVGYFHFVDSDQDHISLQTWSTNTLHGTCRADGRGLHYPVSQAGVWVDCFRVRAPVIHNDYRNLPHKKGLPAGHVSLVRDLAVPVVRDGAVVGIFGVGNKPEDYGQDDVAVLQDIAALTLDLVAWKQAEAALLRRTDELQQINAELEEFAYVASHDLKAPLRAVSNLATVIEQDVGDRLDEENRGRLRLMRERVKGMYQLIDGLLGYAQLKQAPQKRELAPLAPLLRELIDTLAFPPNIHIVLEEPLPALNANPLQLRRIFQNLISNAIHHHDRPRGTVRVRARDAGSVWHIEVADDGPGIPAYAREQIFRMFSTGGKLGHSGIGLATVRKLVLAQGGQIQVFDNQPRGAVFRISWPK